MSTIHAGPAAGLKNEFARARLQLLRAQRRRAGKDTPANRATVAVSLAHIDTVLDMYLEDRNPAL
jgi:hypothetical protein